MKELEGKWGTQASKGSDCERLMCTILDQNPGDGERREVGPHPARGGQRWLPETMPKPRLRRELDLLQAKRFQRGEARGHSLGKGGKLGTGVRDPKLSLSGWSEVSGAREPDSASVRVALGNPHSILRAMGCH